MGRARVAGCGLVWVRPGAATPAPPAGPRGSAEAHGRPERTKNFLTRRVGSGVTAVSPGPSSPRAGDLGGAARRRRRAAGAAGRGRPGRGRAGGRASGRAGRVRRAQTKRRAGGGGGGGARSARVNTDRPGVRREGSQLTDSATDEAWQTEKGNHCRKWKTELRRGASAGRGRAAEGGGGRRTRGRGGGRRPRGGERWTPGRGARGGGGRAAGRGRGRRATPILTESGGPPQ